jgi:hypothetical protein
MFKNIGLHYIDAKPKNGNRPNENKGKSYTKSYSGFVDRI